MQPAMSRAETDMLAAFMCCAGAYVEFGAGGSSVMASGLVRESIVSVDSSQEWLDKVAEACASRLVRPRGILADIGPTAGFGHPQGDAHRDRWANYHTGVWTDGRLSNADLYLIDGRFRVACFLQAILRCRETSVVLIHDFQNRAEYHVVRGFASELARCENLSAFRPSPATRSALILDVIARHAFDPR